MIRKSAVYSLFLLLALVAFAQNEQAEYLEAKRLFKAEQYKEAKTAFAQLTEDDVFGKHASFYYGLSAFKEGEVSTATGMWKQVLTKYPKWEELTEVLFWLAYANFEQGDHGQGLKYAAELSKKTGDSKTEKELIARYVAPLELNRVEILYQANPESRELARVLIRKLNKVEYQQRDINRITELIEKWDFQMEEITSFRLPENVRKQSYDIAVLMPFLYESLSNTNLIIQNNLVMHMYQGMLMAAQDLAEQGKPLNLVPYDTKRREEVTRDILKNDRLKKMDVIVGPLYPGPNAVVNEFSLKYKVNTFNPISSNNAVIDGNPLSFLLMPSYHTIAREMAEFAATENENKNAMIFYEENERDSIIGAVYKQAIEEAGFEVVLYKAMNKENSKEVIEAISSQSEVFLTKEQADSIQLLPGRFVRTRRVRSDELKRVERNPEYLPVTYDEQGTPLVYYENQFHLGLDSIGHIFGATRSNHFANNLISAVETRSDKIKLYGYSDWLDFTMLSYDQLQRLSVALSFPDYVDRDDYVYKDLLERFKEKYKTNPSINHFRGYATIWYIGSMLHRYGKYFQEGLRDGEYYEGKVFEGYRYGTNNDNQVVPIVRFKDSKLEVVNKDNYEDREK